MPNCKFPLITGNRRGQGCGAIIQPGNKYCYRHTKSMVKRGDPYEKKYITTVKKPTAPVKKPIDDLANKINDELEEELLTPNKIGKMKQSSMQGKGKAKPKADMPIKTIPPSDSESSYSSSTSESYESEVSSYESEESPIKKPALSRKGQAAPSGRAVKEPALSRKGQAAPSGRAVKKPIKESAPLKEMPPLPSLVGYPNFSKKPAPVQSFNNDDQDSALESASESESTESGDSYSDAPIQPEQEPEPEPEQEPEPEPEPKPEPEPEPEPEPAPAKTKQALDDDDITDNELADKMFEAYTNKSLVKAKNYIREMLFRELITGEQYSQLMADLKK